MSPRDPFKFWPEEFTGDSHQGAGAAPQADRQEGQEGQEGHDRVLASSNWDGWHPRECRCEECGHWEGRGI